MTMETITAKKIDMRFDECYIKDAEGKYNDSMPGPNTKFGVFFPSHIFTNTLPIWLKIGSSCY